MLTEDRESLIVNAKSEKNKKKEKIIAVVVIVSICIILIVGAIIVHFMYSGSNKKTEDSHDKHKKPIKCDLPKFIYKE